MTVGGDELKHRLAAVLGRRAARDAGDARRLEPAHQHVGDGGYRGRLGPASGRRPIREPEAGGLTSDSEQAAGLWLADGPPAARRAKAATVAAIADVLARRLKPARLSGIARRPAPEYGGKTMLELIAADRHDWLLDLVRRSFDYAATA